MGYLLRLLLSFLALFFIITLLTAHHVLPWDWHHIALSIPLILLLIFTQAFIMFYFIGVSRLVDNIMGHLNSRQGLEQLFDTPPADITPYLQKMNRIHYQTSMFKRQTVPWCALIITLGIVGFLLGAALDTGKVNYQVHVGVVYGFLVAFVIGFYKQWIYLGKAHQVLREVKHLFMISDDSM